MKLPNEVNVSGINYRVSEVNQIEHDDANWGVTIYETHQIQIKKSLDKERKRQIFIHEVLHAVFFESGYKEHDEEMIDRIGTTLAGALKKQGNSLNYLV